MPRKANPRTILLLLTLLLSACNFPYATPVAVEGQGELPCAFMWATKGLPELSNRIQSAIESAGLKRVTIYAEAFGENCVDTENKKIVSFGAMETDFHVTASVDDLTDKDALGNLLEKIMIVLDGFPAEEIPGPNPGIVNVSFQSGNEEFNMGFNMTEGKSARDAGLHGEELFEKLLSQ
jgi:hypothetical protein